MITIARYNNAVLISNGSGQQMFPIGSLKVIKEKDSLTVKHLASRKTVYTFRLGDVSDPEASDLDELFSIVSDIFNGTVTE